MAFPTGTTTKADVQVMEPSIWGDRLNDFFKCELNLAAFFVDRSDELRAGGDRVFTPNITQMSANIKNNGANVTLRQLGACVLEAMRVYRVATL